MIGDGAVGMRLTNAWSEASLRRTLRRKGFAPRWRSRFCLHRRQTTKLDIGLTLARGDGFFK